LVVGTQATPMQVLLTLPRGGVMIMRLLQHREISALTAALWWPWPRLISQIVAPEFTAAGVQWVLPRLVRKAL
jgi:hypothetical protein